MSTAVPMFYRCIPKTVSYDPDLPPLAHHLFVMIAHEVHLDTGKVQMTMEYLAQITHMSVRNILRYLPILEEKGYVCVHRAPKGSKIPNIYELIGIAREAILPKGKADTLHPPAEHATPEQVTNRPPTQKRTLASPPSTLNAHAPTSPVNAQLPAINRQPGTLNGQAGAQSPSIEASDQATQWQTTKQEGQGRLYEESSVVEEPFNQEPPFRVEGVHPSVMQGWINRYGINRVREVITAMGNAKNVGSKGGWIRSALEENWQFGHKKSKSGQTTTQDFLNDRYAYTYKNVIWKE